MEEGKLGEIEAKRAHTKTFLRILKKDYSRAIRHNSEW